MKKIYLCTAIAMTLLTACQENETLVTVTPTETNDTEVVISATIDESATRTHLSESDNGKRHVLWDASDNVAVFYGYDKPSKFTVKSGENTTYAQFSTRKIEKGNAIDHYVGLYPYDADATITYATEYNYTTYTVTTTFPAEQSYQENSYGVGAAPMMAVSTSNSSLSFKNMCTSVKINLKGTQKVSRIEIISLDEDKPIAGKYRYRYTLPQEYYDFEDRIKIEPVAGEAVNMITLDCGEGVQLNTETATGFIFTMPPREFDDNELLFRVIGTDGKAIEVYKEANWNYKRSQVVSIGGDGYDLNSDGTAITASVGGKSYETITEAWEEAIVKSQEPVATLDIYKDIVLGAPSTAANSLSRTTSTDERDLTEYVIPAGKTLTLNLNGHSIRGVKACKESFQMINNKGTLIITGNGTISFKDNGAGDPSYGWGSYTIRNEGTLIVENGTIEHLGVQDFATHMICAIFQYSGSTTINGGTISTPNYRSARLWKGDMTINGGDFKGQLWVQAVDNTAKLIINGGTFAPSPGDGSSVYITNAGYDVAFAVTGGYFYTKIGCYDANALAGAITGGTFTEPAKTSTNAALLATGYQFVANGNGTYSVKK